MTPSRYVPVTELARELACSRRTVYRWVSGGQIPAERLGGRYLRLDRRAVYFSLSKVAGCDESKKSG